MDIPQQVGRILARTTRIVGRERGNVKTPGSDSRRQRRYWLGADLALEVVSEEKPERDLVQKRGNFAEGRVLEYWIVNPQTESVTVLRLRADADRILEDRDYLAGSLFLDADPSRTRNPKAVLGTPDDSFTAIPPDPTREGLESAGRPAKDLGAPLGVGTRYCAPVIANGLHPGVNYTWSEAIFDWPLIAA